MYTEMQEIGVSSYSYGWKSNSCFLFSIKQKKFPIKGVLVRIFRWFYPVLKSKLATGAKIGKINIICKIAINISCPILLDDNKIWINLNLLLSYMHTKPFLVVYAAMQEIDISSYSYTWKWNRGFLFSIKKKWFPIKGCLNANFQLILLCS